MVKFPIHIPTYEAALRGMPVTKGRWLSLPMEEKDARQLARGAFLYMQEVTDERITQSRS